MHIGQVIRQKRQAQSLSATKLAEILNIDNIALCRYEKGRRKVSKNHAAVITSYLNGDYDQEIYNALISDLRKKYEHLTGKKGLQLWA